MHRKHRFSHENLLFSLFLLTKRYTVKPVLTTTSEQRPPVNNDHPKCRPTTISPKVTSEQRPPVNYDQRPLKFGQK